MHIFYVPEISGEILILNSPESKHATKVLRLKKGSAVKLVDGKGGLYIAEITDPGHKHCHLKIIESEKEYGKRKFSLHIAIAPTKSIDRFEWFIEKVTEIGIDKITPLLTGHSERKIINSERLEKILISAVKQSVKAYIPKLNSLTKFDDFINNCNNKKRYIAHCLPESKPHLKDLLLPGADSVIMIGPEGDFTPDEIKKASAENFVGVSLGNSRLRTETAGVVACHIVNLINE